MPEQRQTLMEALKTLSLETKISLLYYITTGNQNIAYLRSYVKRAKLPAVEEDTSIAN